MLNPIQGHLSICSNFLIAPSSRSSWNTAKPKRDLTFEFQCNSFEQLVIAYHNNDFDTKKKLICRLLFCRGFNPLDGVSKTSATNRQLIAEFLMAREADISNFTK